MSKRGEINGWTCEECGETTYAIHVDDGVTPFYLGCRASGSLDDCRGMAKSLFYPAGPPPPHVLAAVRWEWYTPSKSKRRRLSPETREHVDKGGLLIRALTDKGRGALAEFHAFPPPPEDTGRERNE